MPVGLSRYVTAGGIGQADEDAEPPARRCIKLVQLPLPEGHEEHDDEAGRAPAVLPSALPVLHLASTTYRIATDPRAGRRIVTLGGGFSLQAATRCRAGDRWRLARLCRYVTRLDFADDQLDWDVGKRVTFALKTPWRDGTTHPELTPAGFLERLAALVPQPRLHLVRFYGVLAPNANLRALVVPRVVQSIYEVTELSEVPRHRHAAKLRCATSCLPPPRVPMPTSG